MQRYQSLPMNSKSLNEPLNNTDDEESGNEIERDFSNSTGGSTGPSVYRFNPSTNFKKLYLFNGRLPNSPLKAIVRRPSLLIVSERIGEWWYITCSGFEGWANVAEASKATHSQSKPALELVHELRRYEDWRGNNYFFCNGAAMVGSDGKFFLFTNLLLIVPSIFFFIFVVPASQPNYWIVSASLIVLLIYSMFNLWMAALLDPGIIPRNPPHFKAVPPPGAEVGNSAAGWKYCETCNIYRPPRSKHCASCQNCVDCFDHHCPWTGNCIAKRNYRYFLRFILAVAFYTLGVLVVCVGVLVQDARDQHTGSAPEDLLNALAANPTAVLSAALTFFSVWSLFSLVAYHCYLIARGQTTNEHMRGAYQPNQQQQQQQQQSQSGGGGGGTNSSSKAGVNPNPYSRGTLGNMMGACCAPLDPSMLPPLSAAISANQFIIEQLPHSSLVSLGGGFDADADGGGSLLPPVRRLAACPPPRPWPSCLQTLKPCATTTKKRTSAEGSRSEQRLRLSAARPSPPPRHQSR